MKLYAPAYFTRFKCIADRCRHSCCIGWEIDIDSDTLEQYHMISHPYAKTVLKSISHIDKPHFTLCENERCPHLREDGLCELILQLGEDNLCEICREHPRFYHDIPHGMEVGIGMSCEEACRIILSSDDYDRFIIVDELLDGDDDCFFDSLSMRERVYQILKDDNTSYSSRLSKIESEFDVSVHDLSDEQVLQTIQSLEYLNELHKELFLHNSACADASKACQKQAERALAYFVFRHCSDACDENEFRGALRFCLVCERILISMARHVDVDTLEDFARILSEEIEYSESNTDSLKTLCANP